MSGPLVFNNTDLIREAALAGQGLAYVYENDVAADLKTGRLVRPWTSGVRPFQDTISTIPAGGKALLRCPP